MSLLAVGISHRSAPLELLERAAVGADGARDLARALVVSPVVAEAVVLATCNRLEVYAEVDGFHAGVHELSEAIATVAGVDLGEIADHLYFHHGERAVDHLFTVSAGLDSMALGEGQVLGQVRLALRRAQDDATVGPVLGPLAQHALRTGKRVHAETGLDRAGTSLVEAALQAGAQAVGAPDLSGRRALVVGAGSMSALAATTLVRHGAGRVDVANRSAARAQRLAERVGGSWLVLDDVPALERALAAADVVITCTGATGAVLTADLVERARSLREAAAGDGAPAADQVVVDLALPRDVEPAAGDLPGVHLVGLAELRVRLATTDLDVAAARAVVDAEVADHLASVRAARVGPTVAALRARASEVVTAEMARLDQRSRRTGGLDPGVRAEVESTVHRVVEKLLHTPSVRVRELAAEEEEGSVWAEALRELFDLPGERLTSGEGSVLGVSAVLDAPRGPAR